MIDLFKVSTIEADRRLELCKGCEFVVQAKFGKKVYPKCSKCGCFMNLKTKLIGMKCPVDKW